MNKWTLKFENQALENQFQAKQLDNHKILIFKVISVSSILLHIGKMISDSYQNQPLRIEFQTPGLIVSIITLFVIFKHPKYSSNMMTLLNYSLSIVQFWVDNTYGQQRSFVLGSNVIASQMILMMTLDFDQIVPQIIIQCILKQLILNKHGEEKLNIVTILYSVLMAISSIIAYYLLGKAKRQQFLLTVREDTQLQYLPRLISVPFIFFEYQQGQFQPILLSKQNRIKKWNANLCDGCNLRSLIRYINYGNQTLESYFLEKLSANKSSLEQGSIIEEFTFAFQCYAQIDVIITITDKVKFLIRFTNASQLSVSEKIAINKINHFYRLIREVFKCIQKPQKYQTLLFDISIQFISGFYLYGNKEVHYHPVEILKNVIRFVGASNVLLNVEQQAEGFSLIGLKNQFSVYFLQICRILMITHNEDELIIIRINVSQDDQLIFEFSLKRENLQKFIHLYKINKFLHNLEQILFEKSIDFQKDCQLKMKKISADEIKKVIEI